MKKIENSDFKPGYVVNKIKNNNTVNSKFKKKKHDINEDHSFAYPNGMIPMIAINVAFIVGVSLVFGIGFGSDVKDFNLQWPNALISLGVAHLLLHLLWFVARLDSVALAGFGTLKMKRTLKLDRIRRKMKIYVHDQAIDEVQTHDEFVLYCSERKKYTKKFFYISSSVSLIVFITCTLIGLLIQHL
ncbi:MAG: hypothetical protein ACRC42_01105 [Mycoplasma sp.]